jgi:BirA family biotin operon repressor/biotin-[acetyl-CoA-carboxylase] ligase
MTFTRHIHLSEVASTNEVARELLRDVESVIVSADHQTGGKGRRGRTWHDQPGESVLVTFGLRHNKERSVSDLAADMARGCLAALKELRQHDLNDKIRCKYPNDVQAREENGWRKLSGVLVEHDFMGQKCQTTVIGIGMNVLQTEFSETIGQPATSLRRLGINITPQEMVRGLRLSLEPLIGLSSEEVFKLWRSELGVGVAMVELHGNDGKWKVSDLDENGRLVVVNINDGTQRIIDDGETLRYLD